MSEDEDGVRVRTTREVMAAFEDMRLRGEISVTAICQRVRCNRAMWYRWLRGEAQIPLDVAARLAQEFGGSVKILNR